MTPQWRKRTYKSATGHGFVGKVEGVVTIGESTPPSDIKFGFGNLREARYWVNKRHKELRGEHYDS